MNQWTPLAQSLCDLKEDEVRKHVSQLIDTNTPVGEILSQCHQGMAELGRRFDQGECFIPELVIGGKIMEKVMQDLDPLLKDASETVENAGCVVMGTVEHDVHDIGKDIVVMMLQGAGFEVINLGVNVPPKKFVDTIQEKQPFIIGMSVLVTTCYKSVDATVHAIQKAGLRNQVSIMLGGAAATQILADKTGCDFYGKTAIDAVNFSKQLAFN